MSMICFVCSSNTCRSPMLAGLTLAELSDQGYEEEFKIENAGVSAVRGERASRPAIVEMEDRGVNLRAHRSKPVEVLKRFPVKQYYVATNDLAQSMIDMGFDPATIEVLNQDNGGVVDPSEHETDEDGGKAAYEACARLCEQLARKIANQLIDEFYNEDDDE